MAHYDLQNFDIMGYLINRAESLLNKMKDKSRLLDVSIRFFKKIQNRGPSDHRILLEELDKELNALKNDPYEKRAFFYLDIFSWVESKIRKQSISQIIKSAADSPKSLD